MFYEKLKENRKKLGLSQEALAEKLNVSKQTVSKWESGISMPDIENLVKLSNLFNISTDYLLKDRKSDSDFSYYTVVKEEKRLLSRYKIVGLLLIILSVLILLTLLIVTIVEPMTYMVVGGRNYDGFIAYCYIYDEFFVAVIFSFSVLILSIFSLFISDNKMDMFFHKKI